MACHLRLISGGKDDSLPYKDCAKIPPKLPEVKGKIRPFEGFSDAEVELTHRVRSLFMRGEDKWGGCSGAAQIMGISQAMLNLYLSGRRVIGASAIELFCKLFECHSSDLCAELSVSVKLDFENLAYASSELRKAKQMIGLLASTLEKQNTDLALILRKTKKVM